MNSTTPHKSCGKRYYLNLSTVLKRHYSSDFIIMCTERLSSVLKHLNTYLTANMVEWKYTIRSSHSTSLLLIKCIIKLLCKRGNNPYIASVFYVWFAVSPFSIDHPSRNMTFTRCTRSVQYNRTTES